MNRQASGAAFALGLAAVLWVAHGYLGVSPLALVMTLLIAAVYAAGGLELWRFQQATVSLRAALAALPDELPRLADWLVRLPPGLQNPVRGRIEGERVGLPGPALTPYLVGLLVLLGMLGTFLGMVVTLNGAVLALETTTDLPTIRAALAAPVKGLGLAFGTSVAGVAASAMLGLVSALCRRDRLGAAQALDSLIAGRLRPFSLAHQREATLTALQAQAGAVPALLGQLQATMATAEQRSEDLNLRLLASQDRFHGQAGQTYAALAASVDRSLRDSLTESARLAGATIAPMVQATLAGVAQESAGFQARMVETVQTQLDGLALRFDHTLTALGEQTHLLHQGLTKTARRQLADAAERSAGTAAAVAQDWRAALAQAHSAAHSQDQQRQAAWAASLDAVAASLQAGWQQAGAQALGQQQAICQTLQEAALALQAQARDQARSTTEEVSRLIDSAAQAPRAAAEVVGLLRQQLSDSLARDNDLLDERSRIMATLATVLASVNQASTDQRQAIDALVAASAGQLQQAGARLSQLVQAETGKITAAGAQVTGSAVELASLGEAFGSAVALFGDSSRALTLHLQRIEAALDKSTTRSDEQLAYYVAQAREIIELSVGAQKHIVDELRQLAGRRAPLLGEAA